MHPLITPAHVDAYRRDGAVLIRGLFADYVETLRAGIARNMAEPGPSASENLRPGEAGRFFDDYCNWTRIPEFEAVIRQSPVGEVAGVNVRFPPQPLSTHAQHIGLHRHARSATSQDGGQGARRIMATRWDLGRDTFTLSRLPGDLFKAAYSSEPAI